MTEKFKEYVRTHAFCIVLAFIVFVMGVMMLVNKVFPQVPTQHESLGRDAAGDFNLTGNLRFTSTTDAGLIPNKLTSAQRDAILAPEDGCTIWNITTGQHNFFNGTSWDANSDSASTSWEFDQAVTASDPGSKKMKLDNSAPASATNMFVSETNSNDNDISILLDLLASGDSFLGIQNDNNGNSFQGTISGAIVDNGTWRTIPITVTQANGSQPDSGKIISIQFQNSVSAASIEENIVIDIKTVADEIRNAIYDLFPDALMYVDNGNISETGVNNTFKLIEAWASNGLSHALLAVDHTDDSIKTSEAGEFFVQTVISFNGESEKKYEINIRVFDDSASIWLATDFFGITETSGNDSDEHQLSVIGKVTLDVNDKVGVFVRSPNSSSFKMTDGQLYIRKSND